MLNTDSYLSSIAFRLSQMTDPTISDAVKLHLADALGGLVANLIVEVEHLRTELNAAERRALQWQSTAQSLTLRNHEAWVQVGRYEQAIRMAIVAPTAKEMRRLLKVKENTSDA